MVQGEPKTSALVRRERSHSGWSTELSHPITATGVGGKYRGLRAKDQRSGDRHARIVVGYANWLLSGKRPGHTGSAPDDVRRMVRETVREERSVAVQHSLQARFFGHFELLCDGENMPLGRNGKALTILKYLLANRTRPVSQDHLMGWLWPDSNLKKARWSLNSAIHGLRKLLGRCPSSGGQSVSYILLEEGYYR